MGRNKKYNTEEERKAARKERYKINKEKINEYIKRYREKNKDKVLENRKRYWEKNKEKLKQKAKEKYLKNKEKYIEKSKIYLKNNKEKVIEYRKRYKIKNKDRIKELRQKRYLKNKEKYKEKRIKNKEKYKEYRLNNKDRINKSKKKYRDKQSKINPHKRAWRTVLKGALKRLGQPKEGYTIDLLGYSALDLKNHIQNIFTDGMSWDNYGEWHIDHIKRVCEFDKDTHPSIVNALPNLRPLWATTREINGVVYEGNLNRK